MNFIETRCYKLNKYLLSCIGLWPYHNSKRIRLQRIVFDILLVHYIIFQLTTFITTRFSMELLLEVLPYTALGSMYTMKYNGFLANMENIKKLIESIQQEWIALEGTEEHEILERYVNSARALTIFIASVLYVCLGAFIISGFMPDLFDIIVPLNESRVRELPILVEYFIDQQKYFYPLYLHINFTIFIGATTFLSTESIFALFVAHACGLFRITCYRIENLHNPSASPCLRRKPDKIIYRRIINAVRMYQKAMEFTDLMWSTFTTTYFGFVVLGVGSSIVNLYRLSEALLTMDKEDEIIVSVLLIIAHIVYMFNSNFIGQLLIDHNADIFAKLCDSQWYSVSLSEQKLLLLFMQRSTKIFAFVSGGIFAFSLKGFSSLLNLCLSYFMVLYSEQH